LVCESSSNLSHHLKLFCGIDVKMTEPSLAYEFLSFADFLLEQRGLSTCLWLLLSFGNVQIDVVVDENIPTHCSGTLNQRLLVIMCLCQFFQKTRVDFEGLIKLLSCKLEAVKLNRTIVHYLFKFFLILSRQRFSSLSILGGVDFCSSFYFLPFIDAFVVR